MSEFHGSAQAQQVLDHQVSRAMTFVRAIEHAHFAYDTARGLAEAMATAQAVASTQADGLGTSSGFIAAVTDARRATSDAEAATADAFRALEMAAAHLLQVEGVVDMGAFVTARRDESMG